MTMCAYANVCIYVNVCVYVCMNVCMKYMGIYVYECICIYECMCIGECFPLDIRLFEAVFLDMCRHKFWNHRSMTKSRYHHTLDVTSYLFLSGSLSLHL